jgi:hypothetical protein
MHRRSFLKGAAALAAAPVLPAIPALPAPPLVTTISAKAIIEGAIRAPCLVVTDQGMRLFDSDGPARVLFGIFDEVIAAESRAQAIARPGAMVSA